MTRLEQFLDSDLWKSHEPFTINDICQQLSMPRSVAIEVAFTLENQVTRSKTVTGKTTYQRVSSSRDWVCKPLVKGSFDPGHFRSGEWA